MKGIDLPVRTERTALYGWSTGSGTGDDDSVSRSNLRHAPSPFVKAEYLNVFDGVERDDPRVDRIQG